MIVGLFPELLAAGGVQRAGQHTAAVLATYAGERSTLYRFLSLNDPPGLRRIRVGEMDFVVSAFGRAKARFSLAALGAARRHPILVLAAHPNLAPLAWAMKTLAPRVRTVVLSHGIEVWQPLARLRRRALRHADCVLAPSRYTAQRLVEVQGVAEAKVRQLPWGLDPGFVVALGGTGQNHLPVGFPPGRVILTVGRWAANERYKGVDTLIQALPALLSSAPDVFLVAVGDGDDRGRLERLAAEIGVTQRVHFLAGLTQSELRACYAHCDVFALPSCGEGFGLVFLEAMAQGKPVVGGAHGGTPDIVEDSVTGILVPHGDVARLTQALETLLRNDVLRQQMGLQGHQRVEKEFLFEHFAARLREVLVDLCAS
ncbi:MAG: glycosyltransferase family 4 protein [Acidobacteria bacterium]|nr:glycosyltransferase family 4 protein [Acidobacteriota bacterium]